MTDKKRKAITFAELKAHVDDMTPEQLAMPVCWSGEERGGAVLCLDVLEEDCISPDDGMEPISVYVKDRADCDNVSLEEAERLIRDEEPISAHKGQTLLIVD